MQPQDRQPEDTWQPPQAPTAEYHPVAPPSESFADNQSSTQSEVAETTDDNQYIVATSNEVESDDDYDQELIQWQAVSGVDRNRTTVWYLVFGVIVAGLVALAVFVIHSITFAMLIPVMAIALIVYARRPPAPVNYTLSRSGIHINDRLVEYSTFKSFNVLQHDNVNTINLIPRKRFSLAEVLYFPTEIGEALVDALAARLPMKDAKPDLIDRVVAKLKL